jgi:hypothetical protein
MSKSQTMLPSILIASHHVLAGCLLGGGSPRVSGAIWVTMMTDTAAATRPPAPADQRRSFLDILASLV